MEGYTSGFGAPAYLGGGHWGELSPTGDTGEGGGSKAGGEREGAREVREGKRGAIIDSCIPGGG